VRTPATLIVAFTDESSGRVDVNGSGFGLLENAEEPVGPADRFLRKARLVLPAGLPTHRGKR